MKSGIVGNRILKIREWLYSTNGTKLFFGVGVGVGLEERESGREDTRRSTTKSRFNSAVAEHFQN